MGRGFGLLVTLVRAAGSQTHNHITINRVQGTFEALKLVPPFVPHQHFRSGARAPSNFDGAGAYADSNLKVRGTKRNVFVSTVDDTLF